MPNTLTLGISFVAITCCVKECGMAFAVPAEWDRERRKDRSGFYCPHGHSQSYTGQTEEQRLKIELDQVRAAHQRALDDASHQRSLRAKAERSARTTRGHLARTKRRIANGVCPCCNRSFANLHRHMTTQHPTFIDAAEGDA